MNKKNKSESTREDIAKLVNECIVTNGEAVLAELIYRLEKEYVEIALLATMGEYKSSWTHVEVMNHITFHT
jgi:hypothetical protein